VADGTANIKVKDWLDYNQV